MNFTQSVTTVLREKYATFAGRASRSEFWWFALFLIIIYTIFSALFIIFGGYEWLISVWEATMSQMPVPPARGVIVFLAVLYCLFYLATVVPSFAVTARRLHDRDMSGWWLVGYIGIAVLSAFVPFLGFIYMLAAIAMLIIMALPGTEGENKYGPQPAL